jgi:hypothetical protein
VTATPEDPQPLAGPPPPLTVAASLVAVEAVLFVILAVAELADFESSKAVMGSTTALFFLAYGAGLAVCAWAIWRLRSWGRAPIVVAQLLQFLVAWSFWGGETTWVAIGLGAVAAIVLAGIFHPQSLDALADQS